ncbi:putative F-box protein [Iris pallida]|uniref:F-box protein n=1 Tax=Iris pallida TaxID=29817 RepID=A0AAX6E4G7_IRIPA|nr:putative F-box protein [Iris pallida]
MLLLAPASSGGQSSGIMDMELQQLFKKTTRPPKLFTSTHSSSSSSFASSSNTLNSTFANSLDLQT